MSFNKKKVERIVLIVVLGLCFSISGITQENPFVYLSDGSLIYVADEKGNTIPDYSSVGYKLGKEEIPDIDVKVILTPSLNTDADRTLDIQKAINQLSALPLQKNGYRGSLLLKSGKYRVGSTLHISKSGIVIKGEGFRTSGTEIFYSSKNQSNLFKVSGINDVKGIKATRKKVIDTYEPIGAKTITVESGHTFKVGDKVLYVDEKKPVWVETLGMNQLEAIGKKLNRKKTVNWSADEYTMAYKRVVTAVVGNKITLDAPVMEFMDGMHSKAYVEKYQWKGSIENIGFENFKALSYYASDNDENHGWIALDIANVENFWTRNVHAQYFGKGLLNLSHVYKATISDCKSSDFKSKVVGGRRYGFSIGANSERCLVTNCISENGSRHGFLTGARTKGPNVFFNCIVKGPTFNDSGPHERWAVGTLWENIKTPGIINIQNRGVLGTGHGWAGAQNTFWNCKAGKSMSVNNPPLAYKNYIMGCITPNLNKSSSGKARGNIERAEVYSHNKQIPFSLFEMQTKETELKNFNLVGKKSLLHEVGIVDKLKVSDSLWNNKGAITLEFKLNKQALKTNQLLVNSPVLKLELKNNYLWPTIKAALQPKGERKERVQFVFFNTEQWYHLTILWDGPKGKFRLYLNGEKQQPSYFKKWTKANFQGNLILGNENVNIRNISLYNQYLDDDFISLEVNKLNLLPLSGEGRQTFSESLNLKKYNRTLIYDANQKDEQYIVHESTLFKEGKRVKKPEGADWVLEGNAKAIYKDKSIIVSSLEEGDITKNHAVLWNTTVFPENFLLEFEMTPQDSKEGLGIIFFSATAHNSVKDVFALHLEERNGHFEKYMNGGLDCYHTSYWASNKEKGSRETTNLRKNKGFKLVALGDENIGRHGHSNKGKSSERHLVRLLKINGKIQLETRGQLVLSWQDEGTSLGKILGKGQIGLRHMGHAREVTYCNFKVYKITK